MIARADEAAAAIAAAIARAATRSIAVGARSSRCGEEQRSARSSREEGASRENSSSRCARRSARKGTANRRRARDAPASRGGQQSPPRRSRPRGSQRDIELAAVARPCAARDAPGPHSHALGASSRAVSPAHGESYGSLDIEVITCEGRIEGSARALDCCGGAHEQVATLVPRDEAFAMARCSTINSRRRIRPRRVFRDLRARSAESPARGADVTTLEYLGEAELPRDGGCST